MTAEVSIREAETSDVPALLAIEEAAFPGDWLEARAFRHAVRSPTISLIVMTDEEGVAGYALVHRRRNSDLAQIASIALDPSRTGGGLGRRLLEATEEEALAKGCRRIRLEVRGDNAPARHLYESSGYEAFETVPDYYDDGQEAVRYEKGLGM